MTQVTVMVTLTYPAANIGDSEAEIIAERVESVLVRELEHRGFPGCSQIEAEAEVDV